MVECCDIFKAQPANQAQNLQAISVAMIATRSESSPAPEKPNLNRPQVDLTTEWEQLCDWFKSKAAEIIAHSLSERSKEIILFTVAAFCRDSPPRTAEGLEAFRSFAKRHIDHWQSAPLPESGEMPVFRRQ